MAKIRITRSMLRPAFPAFQRVVSLALAQRFGGNDSTTLDINADELTIDEIETLADSGVEVENVPVWLELTNTQYNQPVPAYVPNRENELGAPIKWSAWKDARHEHRKIGTKWYVPGDSWGTELPGNVVSQLKKAGIVFRTITEIRTIYAAASE